MKLTWHWLLDHLQTDKNLSEILETLPKLGLEVASVINLAEDLKEFISVKVLEVKKHPNADKLKVCDVDVGKENPVKVVCGAPNAIKGLLTIYAPPGSVIPKNQMKLVVSKIRGVSSYGMLCSESELNLSDESDGITELSSNDFKDKIGDNYFPKKNSNVIDISMWSHFVTGSYLLFA